MLEEKKSVVLAAADIDNLVVRFPFRSTAGSAHPPHPNSLLEKKPRGEKRPVSPAASVLVRHRLFIGASVAIAT